MIKKKYLNTVETKRWQKKFIKAQNPILSLHAKDFYTEFGSGLMIIDCNYCLPEIVPGLNIPKDIVYSPISLHKEKTTITELCQEVDFSKNYILCFRTFTQEHKNYSNYYINDLEILSGQELKDRCSIASSINELITESDYQYSDNFLDNNTLLH